MRKVIIAVAVCLMISQPAYAADDIQKCPNDMENVILELLTDSIIDAIEDYYGLPRLYWPDSDKVLSVCEIADPTTNAMVYEVVIQVETFYGPHNSPYGIESMSFLIGHGGIKLLSFEHQDKPS